MSSVFESMVQQTLRPATPIEPHAKEKPQKQYYPYVLRRGAEIEALKQKGLSTSQIAKVMGLAVGTIGATYSLYRRI